MRKKVLFLILAGMLVPAGCTDDSDQGAAGAPAPGVGQELEITRDDKGVWFITGPEDASLYEVFEAMGYAVASDRLWQLEQYRRTGRGRLSEILGPGMVGVDTYLRTRAYSDEELQAFFDNLDPDSQAMIQGYLDGINRRIARVIWYRVEPYEFKAIALQKLISGDLTPVLEPWTVIDLMGWVTVLQRDFDREANSRKETNNAALFNDLADNFPADYLDMFEDLRWLNDPDALTYIPGGKGAAPDSVDTAASPLSGNKDLTFPDLRKTAADMEKIRNEVVESLKSINAYVKMGSYGWVVSGDKTASGNPILYSGPQMGFPVPSIVVEGSIRAGGFNISGMTVPGMPGLIISRTPHHAFAMMTGHTNSVDFYIEEPGDVFLHRSETIKVLGDEDVQLDIYRSSHGPVISPMPYDPATYDAAADGQIISWKYSHWGNEFESTSAFLRFVNAADMDEFEDAMEDFPASFHVLYADQDGNIAYWMTGRDPVRPPGEWRLPQGFLGPHLEWDPEVLVTRSTHRNTPHGFYGGWNNKTNSGYDSDYGPFHRAHVIHDYLNTHNNLAFDDVRNLALNIATTDSFGSGGNPWKFVDSYFTTLVEANPTAERTAALAVMAGWDGHFVAGGESEWAWGTDRSDAWVLMNDWIREVIRLTFEDELGSGESTANLFNVLLHSLPGTTLNNRYNWFQNLSDGSAPQTLDDIILEALDNVLAELGARPWGAGARGEINFNHPVLETFGAGLVHTMPRSSRSTYAQCVEFGPDGPVRIESMLPLGESGDIQTGPLLFFTPVFDPHFLSMTEVFDGFVHRPFPLFD